MASKWGDSASSSTFSFRPATPMHSVHLFHWGSVKEAVGNNTHFIYGQLHNDDWDKVKEWQGRGKAQESTESIKKKKKKNRKNKREKKQKHNNGKGGAGNPLVCFGSRCRLLESASEDKL